MNVRDVHFDDGPAEHLERIEDRYRREAVAGGVDHNARARADRLVDPVDQDPLGIGLPELEREAELPGPLATHRLDLGKRRGAVNMGLAGAEQVQIGAVQDEHGLAHAILPSLLEPGRWSNPDARFPCCRPRARPEDLPVPGARVRSEHDSLAVAVLFVRCTAGLMAVKSAPVTQRRYASARNLAGQYASARHLADCRASAPVAVRPWAPVADVRWPRAVSSPGSARAPTG